MIRAAALALLALPPPPAAAQDSAWPIPWDGYWTGAQDDCHHAARYDGPGITSETLCTGLSAHPLAAPSSWLVQMRCDDEGRVWTAPRVVLLDGDRMWIWFGPGGIGAIELARCARSGEY